MNGSGSQSILLCDDDRVFRQRMARALRDRGLIVFEAENSREALEFVSQKKPGRALLDLRMPGESGLDLIARIKDANADVVIVVLTGYGSIATAVDALRRGAHNYLTKPVDPDTVLNSFLIQVPDGARVEPHHTPRLEQVEWDHIQRVVQDCEGNITVASKRLGLHRRSLQRKLAKIPTKIT